MISIENDFEAKLSIEKNVGYLQLKHAILPKYCTQAIRINPVKHIIPYLKYISLFIFTERKNS